MLAWERHTRNKDVRAFVSLCDLLCRCSPLKLADVAELFREHSSACLERAWDSSLGDLERLEAGEVLSNEGSRAWVPEIVWLSLDIKRDHWLSSGGL